MKGKKMNQKLRIKMGDNEIEIEGSLSFIKSQLNDFYKRLEKGTTFKGMPTKEDLPYRAVATAKPTKPPPLSAAEYYRQKDPKSGTEKLIVAAKYLVDYKSISEFTKKDIESLVLKEIKTKAIHNEYFRLAVKQGLINLLGNKKYSLTISGEDAVVAMPAKKE